MADTFTRCAKVCGLVFLIVLFLGADWLGRKSPIMSEFVLSEFSQIPLNIEPNPTTHIWHKRSEQLRMVWCIYDKS